MHWKLVAESEDEITETTTTEESSADVFAVKEAVHFECVLRLQ